MLIAKLTDGRKFSATSENSLLDAALAAGIVLPYSCKTGRCSTCKAKVLTGTTQILADETGLTSEEVDEGWILTCVRAAKSDVELEAEFLGDVFIPESKTLPCRISNIEKLTPDILEVTLRLPPTANFNFIPGQYIDVIGPGGVRRSYSLANCNFSEKLLKLHIREVPNGVMSLYWFGLAKINDLLRLNGPLGTFFLREITGMDLFFLATGTGIAPVKAILESLQYLPSDKHPNSVTVLWGGRRLQDLYLDISSMPGIHTYIPVQSRPDNDWAGAKGYVQDVLLGLSPNWNNAAVYACGSDNMINSAKKSLVEAGLSAKRFYSDAFVCSAKID